MTNQEVEAAENKELLFKPPKFKYVEAIGERFPDINKTNWNTLINNLYPSANTIDSIIMVLSYCQARNLDPFKKPVHIVPVWSKQHGGFVDTVWPGISEVRITAARSKEYGGFDACEFGPMIERTFTGPKTVWVNGRKTSSTGETTISFPEWAQITVYRIIGQHRCEFKGPQVWWLETYGRSGKSELPNDQWERRPHGQLEKCAEAAALRRAFPEEAPDYTLEEMQGQVIEGDGHFIGGAAVAVDSVEEAPPPPILPLVEETKAAPPAETENPAPPEEAANVPDFDIAAYIGDIGLATSKEELAEYSAPYEEAITWQTPETKESARNAYKDTYSAICAAKQTPNPSNTENLI